MFLKKMKREQELEYSFDIKQIVFKVTQNTLKGADTAIKHIQRNKRLYKRLVILLAVCMMPELINVGMLFIVDFIKSLSLIPHDRLMEFIYDLLIDTAKIALCFLIGLEVVQKVYHKLLKTFNIG